MAVENVAVGEGIDGLLSLVARMYVAPGDAVVTSLGAYPTFNFHVASVGGRLVTVPYENDHESLEGLLAAVIREKAPPVYLSNPDNPMGSWWGAGEIIHFIEALPETTMLVLDEAYGELGVWTIQAADDCSLCAASKKIIRSIISDPNGSLQTALRARGEDFSLENGAIRSEAHSPPPVFRTRRAIEFRQALAYVSARSPRASING